ncbi:MAG: hypothetical protein QNK03_04165 [Myxococcota bacterium]|nr:hypothetical protein [Myxococcota bacterium]
MSLCAAQGLSCSAPLLGIGWENGTTDRGRAFEQDRPDTRAAAAPGEADARPLVGASLVRVLRDARTLDFAVKARIYPEDRRSMFVTTRRSGLSVWDVAVPGAPRLRAHWDGADDVEGQDRDGDLLVVVARKGELHTFDVRDPDEPRHLGSLALATSPGPAQAIAGKVLVAAGNPFRALHTKLHRRSDGSRVALVTAPSSRELLAVNVDDPTKPVQVGAVDTGVQLVEGISVHRDHAFVGGFGRSDVYKAVDVSDPTAMRVVASLSDRRYRQMVSATSPRHPDLLYAALWDDPGGLGIFDVRDPPRFRELGAIVRGELAASNRVKLWDHLAFLPLEQEPGGFAVVDVGDPRDPRLVSIVRGVRDVTVPYTLAVSGDHLYLFGSREASMAVFRLERAEPEISFALWNLGPGDADAIAEGRDADRGQGALRFLDATRAETSTRARTGAGEEGGIGYVWIAPAGRWKRENGIVLQHDLAHTFYGTLPAYTVVWDLQVPGDSFALNGCFSRNLVACEDVPLLQLDRDNRRDAELFLKVGATPRSKNGFVGQGGGPLRGTGGLGGYAAGIRPDTWHRVAFVVDLRRETGQASIYVDGKLVHEADGIDFERFGSVAEGDPQSDGPVRDGFLLFADEDGEMTAPVRLASLLFVNRAYDADEVGALGPPGPEGIPAPRARPVASDGR